MGLGKSFTDAIGTGLGGIATDAISTGLGLLLEGHNDRRQIRQQEKLTDIQVAADKNLSEFNFNKQFEMWEKTNYPAQMEMLKKAGLNPALMYGQGGGGGTTTGSGGGNVSGGTAPSGGGEIMGLLTSKMNLSLMAAQKEVLETQAEKNKAEAENVSGAQTTLQTAQAASLTQGIENQKAIAELTKVQTGIAEAQRKVSNATTEEAISTIAIQMQQAQAIRDNLVNELHINQETADTKIKTARAELIKIYLTNTLTKAQTANVQTDTKLKESNISINTAQIDKWSTEISQNWERLYNEAIKANAEDKYVNLQMRLHDMVDSDKAAIGAISDLLKGVIKIK